MQNSICLKLFIYYRNKWKSNGHNHSPMCKVISHARFICKKNINFVDKAEHNLR